MKVLELKAILRKDVPLYYRRDFTAIVVLEIPLHTVESPIDFTIETSPLGDKSIELTLGASIDYPMLPLIKSIKAYIMQLDDEGQLPC